MIQETKRIRKEIFKQPVRKRKTERYGDQDSRGREAKK